MIDVLGRLPVLQRIHQQHIQTGRPFEQVAAGFAHRPGTVILLSGSNLDSSRYHMLAALPWLEIRSKGERVRLRCFDHTYDLSQDPFSIVQSIITHFNLNGGPFDLPVHSGLFGYFSYDLKDRIEKLPRTCVDTHLPEMCLYAPSILLVQDRQTKEVRLCTPEFSHNDIQENHPDPTAFFFNILEKRAEPGTFSVDARGLLPGISKPEYVRAVQKIIAYLKAGDIYQANFSQRFETGFRGDAFALFLDLFNRNPAPFFSYINAGDHTIVSTSPERFIRQAGRDVETRPIKGTIARGKTGQKDKEQGRALTRSLKDDAELTMIVDLMRNDLSRVSHHDSVMVTEHKRLEPYENVYHLVSIVTSRLLEDKTSIDLLRATFPGGSITGCPKIRAMEIIDELEPYKRHVYTGSIGYVSFHDTMDLSIAIRTAVIREQTLCFSVGGGIVFDSDPQKEFQETLDKGRTLIESLSGRQHRQGPPVPKAWADGKIMDQDKVCIPAAGTGVQYGAGLFETIRVSDGHIFYLNEHVTRMNDSWCALFYEPAPDITWENVIRLVIKENNCEKKDLAVKIMVVKDERNNGKTVFPAAFIREYVHRLDMLGKSGLDLVSFPAPRHTFLADHKTCNYLFYEQARRFAAGHGADEALILNPDHTVSETNTANIFAINGTTVVVPESSHMLGGVTLKKTLEILTDKGYEIKRQAMPLEHLLSLPNIILTNSLMGAVRVLRLDGMDIRHDQGICSMINERLFSI